MGPKIFLQTPRLILRQFIEEDANLLFELDNDPEVMRYIGPRQQTDPAGYRKQIADKYRGYYAKYDDVGVWALLERASESFIGWICLRPAVDHRFAAEVGFREGELELGYRLRRTAWGKGYATEASHTLVLMALAKPGPVRIVAIALAANVASTRVMEKVGLKLQGGVAVPGCEQPAVIYSVDKR
jgi:RimJ/RimL family protein N-acetyltransferase